MEIKQNKFKATGNIIKEISLEALVDDYKGLTLFFTSNGPSKTGIKIFFDTYLSYRNSDESERFQSIYKIIALSPHDRMFKTNNSDYIKWLVNESQGIREGNSIIHYLLITPNDIIEVLTMSEPIFDEFEIDKEIFVDIG